MALCVKLSLRDLLDLCAIFNTFARKCIKIFPYFPVMLVISGEPAFPQISDAQELKRIIEEKAKEEVNTY